jgi:hypothetical protein
MTTDPHAIQTSGDGHHEHVTTAHDTTAHGTTASAHDPFPAAEIEDFRRSDRGAAAVVVLLMTGIFLTGVFLYTIVAVATFRG